MPTNTILAMTQEILSAMSSDEVNSIGDTTESLQVAAILQRKTLDIWARSHTPEREQLIQLVPSNDAAIPVMMTIPADVRRVEWIKYFNSNITTGTTIPPGYQYVTKLPIQQFIDMVTKFNISETTVGSFTFTNGASGNYTFYYRNNRQPQYCTIISNRFVIFDAFDNTQDSTLQASKTMVMGSVYPTFTMEDSFVPDLTDVQFSLLINEAKALAFFELKQTQHAKAEQEIQRQWSALQNDKKVGGNTFFNDLPSYGRK